MPDVATAGDAIFQEWDRSDSPGCAVGVVRDGDLVFARGYGVADLDHAVPIVPSSVFHVASVSKQFTAFAILLLAQDSKLTLDGELGDYLPELPTFGEPITLRHLIHHTSGWRDQWDLLALAGWRRHDVVTTADILDLTLRQTALNFHPGDEFLYSNSGYPFLALVVERCTGQTLRTFCADRLFGPLGMARTHFHDDHPEIVPGRALAYEERSGGGLQISIPAFDTVGATGRFTTVEDLGRWVHHVQDLADRRAPILDDWLRPGVLNDGTVLAYAGGVTVGRYRGVPIVEHRGGDAGYRSHLAWFPEQRLGVAVLANLGASRPPALAHRVADLYLGDRPARPAPPAAVTLDPALATRWAGWYCEARSGVLRHLIAADERLSLATAPRTDLVPEAPGRYVAGDPPVQYDFAETPDGNQPSESQAGLPTRTFVAVREGPPTSEQLEAYVGAYWSLELEVPCWIAIADGGLIWRHRKLGDRPLVPVGADTFVDQRDLRPDFRRDRTGQIAGLTISTPRARHLWFERRADDRSPVAPPPERAGSGEQA